MKKICTLPLLAIMVIMSTYLQAQDFPPPPTPMIHVLIRSYSDSIVLRFAPDHGAAWQLTNRYGFEIERGYVDADSNYVSEILTPQPLVPWSLKQMMDYFGPADTLAAVAAQALYGEEFEPVPIQPGSGSLIQTLQRQHDLQQMRFAFAMQAAEFSPKVAEALAMRYCDKNVKQGIIYDYTVRALVPTSIVEINAGNNITLCAPPEPLLAPDGLDIRQSDVKRIELIWLRDVNPGFFVERSIDGGKTYKRLNRLPYYATLPDTETAAYSTELDMYNALLDDYHIFYDSVAEGQLYHYRVLAITSFGELTPASEPLSIRTIDLQPPTSVLINQPEIIDDAKVKLTWVHEEPDDDLAGYIVERSSMVLEGFQPLHKGLLTTGISEFLDIEIIQAHFLYYRVISVDKSGNQSSSMIVHAAFNDLIPPATPQNLTGLINYGGSFELFWDPNTEPDLKGYRVMFANHPSHQYTMITPYPITEPYFNDSVWLRTLTKKMYFKVLAEDHHGNQSEPTEVLVLDKPDIVPPAVPVVLDAGQDDDHVYVTWSTSSSNDVIGYRVFRRQETGEMWDQLQSIDATEVVDKIHITDTPEPSIAFYLYSIEAIDEAGNTSGLSKPMAFRVVGKAVPEIPVQLTGEYEPREQVVNLHWKCDYSGSYQMQILRAVDNDPLDVFKSLEANQTSFTDVRVPKGSRVRYAVRLALPDGRVSKPSAVVTVSSPE